MYILFPSNYKKEQDHLWYY